MDFGKALELLKDERRVARNGWVGAWIVLQIPNPHSKMTHPYLYMEYKRGSKIPWLPSQADLLAEDWDEVRE